MTETTAKATLVLIHEITGSSRPGLVLADRPSGQEVLIADLTGRREVDAYPLEESSPLASRLEPLGYVEIPEALKEAAEAVAEAKLALARFSESFQSFTAPSADRKRFNWFQAARERP